LTPKSTNEGVSVDVLLARCVDLGRIGKLVPGGSYFDLLRAPRFPAHNERRAVGGDRDGVERDRRTRLRIVGHSVTHMHKKNCGRGEFSASFAFPVRND
jgi:hypothetical protein